MTIVRSTASVSTPEAGMVRQVGAFSPQIMLVRHEFKRGWVGASHAHPHHQLVYVIRGAIAVTAGGVTETLRAGDSFVVDGGETHQASALEDSEVIDVFTPVRDDYVPDRES